MQSSFNRPLIKAILDSPKASFQYDKYSRRELEFILSCVVDYYRKEHTMCNIYNKYILQNDNMFKIQK